MLPTLADSGEIVIEDRLTYRLNPGSVARGDLITLRSPIDPSRIICKRVLGLPGDIICVDPTGEKAPSTQHVVIPKGHIWISGDNAAFSRDSRDYGPVSMALIQAKLLARVRKLFITIISVIHLYSRSGPQGNLLFSGIPLYSSIDTPCA